MGTSENNSAYCEMVKRILDAKRLNRKNFINNAIGGVVGVSNAQISFSTEIINYIKTIINESPKINKKKLLIERCEKGIKKIDMFRNEIDIPKIADSELDVFFTETIPKKIASIIVYYESNETYDKESYDEVMKYIDEEFFELKKQNDGKILSGSIEIISYLASVCMEEKIILVCEKSVARVQIERKKLKIDFLYIGEIIFKSMYSKDKNEYSSENIKIPECEFNDFNEKIEELLPQNYFDKCRKGVRANALCKKLKNKEFEYVKEKIVDSQYITFYKIYNESNESNIEKSIETFTSYVNIIKTFTGYNKDKIPYLLKNDFFLLFDEFSKDFFMRIKRYNAGEITEILEIINSDKEAELIYRLCQFIKSVYLIESTNIDEYNEKIEYLNKQEKHIKAICRYYLSLNE